MFRLDINENTSTLYLRDEKKAQEVPVIVVTKDGQFQEKVTHISRTKLCEQGGLIPTSAVYKQTRKMELENENCDKITVERLDDNQTSCTWPVPWTYKLNQGDVTRIFHAHTPDAVLAYEYYFEQVKMNILQTQAKDKQSRFEYF